MRYKYPRTLHLPWSPGATADDKTLKDVYHLIGKSQPRTDRRALDAPTNNSKQTCLTTQKGCLQ